MRIIDELKNGYEYYEQNESKGLRQVICGSILRTVRHPSMTSGTGSYQKLSTKDHMPYTLHQRTIISVAIQGN